LARQFALTREEFTFCSYCVCGTLAGHADPSKTAGKQRSITIDWSRDLGRTSWGSFRSEPIRQCDRVVAARRLPRGCPAPRLHARARAAVAPAHPDEVTAVASELRQRDVDQVDIGVAITQITDELPSSDDIERVRTRLAAKGWPLDDPRDNEDAE
jgi:hypothetical protein